MSEQGERGKTGDTGQVGETGRTGESGHPGQMGPTGDHGQHGDTGFTGRRGERGERGHTGAQGDSTILSRRISLSFLIMFVVIAVAIGAVSWVVVQNRTAISNACEAINESRAVNNRDRLTLLKGARQADADAEDPKNAAVAGLLRKSAQNTREEVRVRPYLEKLDGCDAPVPFPPRDL